jgi:hypothetical protein
MSNNTFPSGDINGGTFYPGDPVYFHGYTGAGYGWNHATETVDPVFYISLPKGIALDPSTVEVQSAAGKNGAAFVPAVITGTPQTQTIDGVEWTTYRVEVNNKYDIIARSVNNYDLVMAEGAGGIHALYTDERNYHIRFTAYIAPNSEEYPAIAMQNILNVDLGQTATGGILDTRNLTGKGENYLLVAPMVLANSPNMAVVLKPGLNVYLGIRVAGTTQNYFTYNGSDVTIAPVSRDINAEIWLKYENTSTDLYYEGSEIYLPIPKKGKLYDHYFNNTNTSTPTETEAAQTSNAAPQWTAELASEAILPGFTTFYGIDQTVATNWQSGGISPQWTPISMTWYEYDDLLAGGFDLADVTMLRFRADHDIEAAGDPNATGETTFLISVGEDAQIGDRNFWRSYQKGWREPTGEGTWIYGGILAASPAMSGVTGKFFHDLNIDGTLDTGEEYADPTRRMSTDFSVTLSGTGITGEMPMSIDADGNFRSLNADGTVFYLREGSFTVKIYNANPSALHFTTVTPDTRSRFTTGTATEWYNDVPQHLSAPDDSQASFPFTVTPLKTETQLVGIGLRNVRKYIPVNPQVRAMGAKAW